MKTLTNNDVILIENIAKVTQNSLQNILYTFLKKHYENNVVYDSNFLLAEGTIPIALVAHMDTVGKQPPKEIFYDRVKNVMWSPQLLGADDRAGVFAIIKIIEAGFKPHIIFTTDEEKGCLGASELAYFDCPFKDLRYIIQLDRRGANDCVFYDCDNKEFEKYIENFGFVKNFGSFSDISELCPSWKIAGVNLSIGYRDEHSLIETLFVGQMLETIEKVKKMLSESYIPKFEYIPDKDSYYFWEQYYDSAFEDNDGFIPIYNNKKFKYKCSSCGSIEDENNILEVKLIKGGKGYFCADCLEKKVDWCWKCGEAFEVDETKKFTGLCQECSKKIKKTK